MRNLEVIEKELAAAREALSSVEGTPAEVYSRIVGYYRSVRNWNRGKREEYGERRLYRVKAGSDEPRASSSPRLSTAPGKQAARPARTEPPVEFRPGEEKLMLFVRSSCPGCPPAKAAAERLGIPVHTVNADTEDGMAEAVRRNVLSTPTAILFSAGGEELRRAGDAAAISRLLPAACAVAV